MANFITDYNELMKMSMKFYRKHWLGLSLYLLIVYFGSIYISLGIGPIETTKILYEEIKDYLKH